MTLDYSVIETEEDDFIEENISPKIYFKNQIEYFAENYDYPDEVCYDEFNNGYGLYQHSFVMRWDTSKERYKFVNLEEVILSTTNKKETSLKFKFSLKKGDITFNYSPLFDNIECVFSHGGLMPVNIYGSDGPVEYFILKSIVHFNKDTKLKENF